MKSQKSGYPSDAEMEILQILWEQGEGTVREIHAFLTSNKKVGQTTVLKQLQRMEEKGYVSRIAGPQPQKFQAVLKEEATKQSMVDKMLGLVFKGSAMELVMHALGSSKPTEKEAEALRKWLDDELNKEQNDGKS